MKRIAKIIGGTIAALSLIVGISAPTFAAAPGGGVVGTWSVVDRGQGCWGGGNLLSDGTGSGGGGCAFSTPTGEEVASLNPVSWSFTDSTHTAVNLCATITGKKGPVFPVGVPILDCSTVVPVNSSAPVNLADNTYAKVTIFK